MSIINNGVKIRNKLKILFLFFIITTISLGCIESQKLPVPNETEIATPSVTEQKLPTYNETKPLKINDTFETWSRGYYSNYYEKRPYFKVITNYSDWIAFLNEQGSSKLEGTLFPGPNKMPKTIEPTDFDKHFIIAAMMGLKAITEGPEIEIKNISRTNNTLNVMVRRYVPTAGALTSSSPYHIVIVKRELIPEENTTFNFINIENGRLMARITGGDYRSFSLLIEAISSDHPVLRNNAGVMEISENYYFGDFGQDCADRCDGKELKNYISGYPKHWVGVEDIVITLQNAFTENERLKNIDITPKEEKTGTFRTVAIGNSSGYTNPAFIVINNRTEWVNVWQKHSSYLVNQKPQVPEVNFTNETIVAVFFGEAPAYDAGLIDITKAEKNVFINLQKKYPASRSAVQPHFIIRLPKSIDNIILRTLRWEYKNGDETVI
ncbi:MAG: hypothetical protein O8C63_13095 [Candidatus Methanoperedens sp.]|nr:hypothetical protein [Candidatus Methanoperedens sp.]